MVLGIVTTDAVLCQYTALHIYTLSGLTYIVVVVSFVKN